MLQVERLDIMSGCSGWRLAAAALGPGASPDLTLRYSELFAVRIVGRSGDGLRCSLQLAPQEQTPHVPADRRPLAACLAAGRPCSPGA